MTKRSKRAGSSSNSSKPKRLALTEHPIPQEEGHVAEAPEVGGDSDSLSIISGADEEEVKIITELKFSAEEIVREEEEVAKHQEILKEKRKAHKELQRQANEKVKTKKQIDKTLVKIEKSIYYLVIGLT